MGTERKRKVSLFDVVDETAVPGKLFRSNGGGGMGTAAADSTINKWNSKPYSQRYYEILEKRKTLPVWHQKEEFLQVLRANQTLILVGETGSGKTTQVSVHAIELFLLLCNLSPKEYIFIEDISRMLFLRLASWILLVDLHLRTGLCPNLTHFPSS